MPHRYEHDAIIRNFFKMGHPRVFHKGEIILGNDYQPDGVYFIEKGYVKSFSISNNGSDYGHIIYGHDEIFPMTWAYLGYPEGSMFYQALDDALTWRISRSWFLHFIHTNPNLGFALSLQLSRQSQLLSQRLGNLEYTKAYERVVYNILFLCRRFGTQVGRTVILDIPLTHEIFASLVNLSRETVSRQIEKLNAEHIISTSRHHYEILDMPALVKKGNNYQY